MRKNYGQEPAREVGGRRRKLAMTRAGKSSGWSDEERCLLQGSPRRSWASLFDLSRVTDPQAMNGEVLQRQVIIRDPLGFHMRPLTAFAQRAGQFQCAVTLAKDNQRVNGKSPLELMLLAAQQGTELTLEVSGPDAARALEVLAEMIEAPGFPEESAGSSLPSKG